MDDHWVRLFNVSDPRRAYAGHTLYKVTSKVTRDTQSFFSAYETQETLAEKHCSFMLRNVLEAS